jgi:hypothetical protein
MRGRIRLLIPALAASAALLPGGCGGDDEAPITPVEGATGATGADGPLSEEEFIAEADSICAEAYTALASLTVGDAGIEAQATQQRSITEGTYDSLRSLGDPPGSSADYDRFLSSLRDAVAAYEEGELAAQRGDTATADAATAEAEAALAEARSAAGDYGLEDCSKEGDQLAEGDVTGSETGGEVAPAEPAPVTPAPVAPTTTTPVTPAPTTPAPAAPPAPTPTPAPAAPAPSGGTGGAPATGGTGGGSGGVSP